MAKSRGRAISLDINNFKGIDRREGRSMNGSAARAMLNYRVNDSGDLELRSGFSMSDGYGGIGYDAIRIENSYTLKEDDFSSVGTSSTTGWTVSGWARSTAQYASSPSSALANGGSQRMEYGLQGTRRKDAGYRVTKKARIRFKFYAAQNCNAILGGIKQNTTPARECHIFELKSDGHLCHSNGIDLLDNINFPIDTTYTLNAWHSVEINVDVENQEYTATYDGKLLMRLPSR